LVQYQWDMVGSPAEWSIEFDDLISSLDSCMLDTPTVALASDISEEVREEAGRVIEGS
jgi:hypothetical protein